MSLSFYKRTFITALLVGGLLELSYGQDIVPQAKPSVYGSSESLKCPIEVKPGQSLGPVFLGMTLNELKKTGLLIKQVYMKDPSYGWYVVGEFSVRVLPHKGVTIVEAQLNDLPDCVFLGKQKIKREAGFKELKELFDFCQQPLDVTIGGSGYQCRGIRVETGWRDVPGLKLRIEQK